MHLFFTSLSVIISKEDEDLFLSCQELDRPLPARTLASLGGTSFGLLWQPLPLMAPVLVCSGSLRMEADRADS